MDPTILRDHQLAEAEDRYQERVKQAQEECIRKVAEATSQREHTRDIVLRQYAIAERAPQLIEEAAAKLAAEGKTLTKASR